MTALFGSAAIADSKNLVQFRCGKMHLRGTTVTADKRKGLLYIYQSEDSLMHFCWKDRTSGVIEDDLIIFPEDTEFKTLPQCTTGRAFILKFKSSTRKFFFWMQEPLDEKDAEHCSKVNELLNHPPEPSMAGMAGGGGAGGSAAALASLQPALASLGDQLGDSGLQHMLSNMDQNQLMQILGMTGLGGAGGAGGLGGLGSPMRGGDSRGSSRSTMQSSNSNGGGSPAAAVDSSVTASITPAVTSVTPSSVTPAAVSTVPQPAVQLSDLQSILSSMQGGGGEEGGQNIDLSTSFTNEALVPLLSDSSVVARLAPFLPEVKDLPSDHNELRDTIQSPQFKQALSIFSSALCSGQLGPLMNQFKLGAAAVQAASKGDIVAFAKALQEEESASKGSADDEDMALD